MRRKQDLNELTSDVCEYVRKWRKFVIHNSYVQKLHFKARGSWSFLASHFAYVYLLVSKKIFLSWIANWEGLQSQGDLKANIWLTYRPSQFITSIWIRHRCWILCCKDFLCWSMIITHHHKLVSSLRLTLLTTYLSHKVSISLRKTKKYLAAKPQQNSSLKIYMTLFNLKFVKTINDL